MSKVVSPKFRVSFPAVFKPKQGPQGGDPKYSVVMLFDSATDISALKKAAHEAAVEKWGEGKVPKGIRSPFRDGNEKDYDGYADCIFVNASSKMKPGLVDQNLQEIISEQDFYAGCYARASVRAFAYDTAGNKGVSFSLENIQKLAEGEAFSGREKAQNAFTKVETESDNEDNYAF